MILDLLRGADPTRSIEQSNRDLLNMYLSVNPYNDSMNIVAYPRPGINTYLEPAGYTETRGVWVQNNLLYAVLDDDLVTINTNGTVSVLGQIGTSTGRVNIVGSNQQILVSDGTSGYIYDIPNTFLLEIETTAGTPDIDALAAANSSSGTTVTLDGAETSGGTWTTPDSQPHKITIQDNGGDDQTDVTFTITGTDIYDAAQTEGITGPGASATVTSSNAYKTVTSITIDSAQGGTETVNVGRVDAVLGVGFPVTTATVAQLDSYFIAHTDNKFYISGSFDGLTWDALDFASAEGNADDILAVEVFQRRLFAIGRVTTEVYYNTGESFPFNRLDGVFINYGCESARSVAVGDKSVIWLGRGLNGQLCVISVGENMAESIISTPALNYRFLTYTTTSDAQGFIYQREGKEFYVLTFPTEDKTWVFDTELGVWQEYQTGGSRWAPDDHVFFDDENVLIEYGQSDSILYKLEDNVYTDKGSLITRRLRCAPLMDEGKEYFFDRLEVDIESGSGTASGAGSDPVMSLRTSKDGGFTWSNYEVKTAGKLGEYYKRLYWNRLGRGRRTTFEISMSDPIEWIVLSAYLHVREGRK